MPCILATVPDICCCCLAPQKCLQHQPTHLISQLVVCHLHASQVEQRFLVQPFTMPFARRRSSIVTATSAAGSSAADAGEPQEATLHKASVHRVLGIWVTSAARPTPNCSTCGNSSSCASGGSHWRSSSNSNISRWLTCSAAVQAGFSADNATKPASAGC